MEIGTNKSLFTLIAVVIFGVFLSLSYWMFQDELTNVLASVFDKTGEMSSIKLENNGLIPTDINYFTYVVTGDNTIKITNYTGNLDGITNVTIPAYIDDKPVTTIGSIAFQGKGLIPTDINYFTYVVTGDNTIKITNYTGNLDGITNVTTVSYTHLRRRRCYQV